MCTASFCHWVSSRGMLLIFTLRRLLILGDGSLFSLLSLTPREEAASKSGLWGGDGPSGRRRYTQSEGRHFNFNYILLKNQTKSSLCGQFTVHVCVFKFRAKSFFYHVSLRRHSCSPASLWTAFSRHASSYSKISSSLSSWWVTDKKVDSFKIK